MPIPCDKVKTMTAILHVLISKPELRTFQFLISCFIDFNEARYLQDKFPVFMRAREKGQILFRMRSEFCYVHE